MWPIIAAAALLVVTKAAQIYFRPPTGDEVPLTADTLRHINYLDSIKGDTFRHTISKTGEVDGREIHLD